MKIHLNKSVGVLSLDKENAEEQDRLQALHEWLNENNPDMVAASRFSTRGYLQGISLHLRALKD